MKTIFLHAGAHKTGSSSIQINLGLHSDLLQAIGLYYPTTWNDKFQYPHTRFRSTGNANPLAYAMRWVNSQKEYKDFNPETIFENLFAEIDAYETVILSHEDLIACPRSFLTQLKNAAASQGWDIKIIIFVRDQISWHISNYKQHIKQNFFAGHFYEILAKSLQSANWALHLQNFADVFGVSNLYVRLLHSNMPKKIVSVFIETIGFDSVSFDKIEEKKVNVGFSDIDALLISHIQRMYQDVKLSHKLMVELSKISRSDSIELLTPEISGFIAQYYSACNAKLASCYLSEHETKALEQAMNRHVDKTDIYLGALDTMCKVVRQILVANVPK